ncbi:MAG: PqqD family protein [Legionella sp.]|nr:PqqD family protein [Legionella sp.]
MRKVDYFIQNKNLLSVEIDDELVMVSDNQENFIALNSTGKFIFDYLASPKSIDEIISAVITQFEVDTEIAMKDTRKYLEKLIMHRLIHDSRQAFF